jgi:SSS family solute:Na+ symporter
MSHLSIDALIVYAFLLITLLVGLWAGRGIKDIREYALANKMYGTGVLTITLLATYITGSQGIGYVGYVFDDGLLPVFSILICGAIICFSFIAHFVAPKMARFEGCLTMAEVMGQVYGQTVRMWMGVLGVFYSIVIATLQIIWLGYIGEIINIPGQWSILLGGAFLVIYSARGGMKAVAITDIIQFAAIVVFVPLVANVLLDQVGGIGNLLYQVPKSNFDVLHHPSFKDYIVYCIWGLFPAFPLSFPFIQRMLMAKNTKQIVSSQYLSMAYLTTFYLLLTLIGLSAIALKVMGDPNMPQQGSKVFVYLTKHYTSPGIQGIIGIGFIGGVMSTADSFLHSAGLLLAHDVIKPLRAKKQGYINELKVSQYATFVLGVLAVILALTHQVLPRIQYGGLDLGKGLNLVIDFIAISFTIPLIAGIRGLKTNPSSFFISLAFTFISFIFAKLFLSNYLLIPFSILANAISFFCAHWIQSKGYTVAKMVNQTKHP